MSRTGDWAAWLRFFLQGVIDSADEAIGLVTALDDLRQEMHHQLQATRSSIRLLTLVDSLFERPAISIGAATKLLGVTTASASANISKLVAANILTEITGRTRDRVYVARRILNLMGDGTAHAARTEASK